MSEAEGEARALGARSSTIPNDLQDRRRAGAAPRQKGREAPRKDQIRRSRHALHDEVAAALRQMIIEGSLRAGDRVPEQQFGQLLGVSRTPLREALKILAAEGLVELRPNRGSVVAPICVDEIASIFELMGALEELTGALVCARISNVEIDELDRLHSQLAEAYRKGSRSRYFALNQEIHRQLVRTARNPVLTASYIAFAEKIRRARFQANYDRGRWEESMREHEAMMKALRARSSKELSRLLREHSNRTGRAVVTQLREPTT